MHEVVTQSWAAVEIDRQGLRILDDAACNELLGSVRLGRIALTNGALPVILPVAFGRIENDLVFNVGPGILARAAAAEHIVCFQTDWADDDLRSAWSVSAIGQLSVITQPAKLQRAAQLDLGTWSTTDGSFLRLEPHFLSGRSRE